MSYKLKEVLRVVIDHGGFPGMGYKAAAKAVALPKSAMRYAKMAYEGGHIAAVALGFISDQRVIGMLHGLPPAVAQAISRTETKLKRKLTRERMQALAYWFWIENFNRLMEKFQIPRFEEATCTTPRLTRT